MSLVWKATSLRLESHLPTFGKPPPYDWKAISLRLGLDAPTAKACPSIQTGGQGYLSLNSAGVTIGICDVETLRLWRPRGTGGDGTPPMRSRSSATLPRWPRRSAALPRVVSSSHVSARLLSIVSRPRAHAHFANGGHVRGTSIIGNVAKFRREITVRNANLWELTA